MSGEISHLRRFLWAFLAATFLIALAACTPSEDASPSPEERTLCEARCFAKRGTCTADDYVCDRAEAACKRRCRLF